MNHSTAIFLINDTARAINVNYEGDASAKVTTYKTFDQDIMVDDLVIVETDTRHGFTVCKVIETDVDLDFDGREKMRWIVGTVDTDEHEKILDQEKQAIAAIKSAELRHKRESLRRSMFSDHMDTIRALPIASMNGDEAPKE